jgi:hypothetical protein
MTCTFPPELSDAQLLTYIDGEASREISTHLARCPSCQARAQALELLQKRLRVQLFRVACPPSLELGEYQAGLLDTEQATLMQQHLATCPHCTRELSELQGYLDRLPPVFAPDRWEQLKTQTRVLVAQLVDALSNLAGPTLAPVGIRGEAERQLVYEAEDVQVILEVQPDAEQLDRKVILGLILGLNPLQTPVTLHLWQEAKEIATTTVDEAGNFVFVHLPTGRYELILRGDEIEIYIQGLNV